MQIEPANTKGVEASTTQEYKPRRYLKCWRLGVDKVAELISDVDNVYVVRETHITATDAPVPRKHPIVCWRAFPGYDAYYAHYFK